MLEHVELLHVASIINCIPQCYQQRPRCAPWLLLSHMNAVRGRRDLSLSLYATLEHSQTACDPCHFPSLLSLSLFLDLISSLLSLCYDYFVLSLRSLSCDMTATKTLPISVTQSSCSYTVRTMLPSWAQWRLNWNCFIVHTQINRVSTEYSTQSCSVKLAIVQMLVSESLRPGENVSDASWPTHNNHQRIKYENLNIWYCVDWNFFIIHLPRLKNTDTKWNLHLLSFSALIGF